MPKRIVILGATGSIGIQTIDLIRQHRDLFEVLGVSSGGSQARLLIEQAVEFRVPYIGVAQADFRELTRLLAEVKQRERVTNYNPQLLVGPQSSTRLAALEGVLVVNAITGSIGLEPTLVALDAGNKIALANKESLVVGGQLVVDAARCQGGDVLDAVYPVDSEHSAILQCLTSGVRAEVDRLIITASGGPFRGYTADQLEYVSVDEAMKHPTWAMGPVITVNSATLVNKGLEVMEASLLFDIPIERIDTVVHPQSVVHSMVQYIDGSLIAQASPPDMKLPIALALNAPERLDGVVAPLNFMDAMDWSFEPLDEDIFPAVALARGAMKAGTTFPAVYNAANEEAVAAFVTGRIRFLDITNIIDATLTAYDSDGKMTLDAISTAEAWARSYANGQIAAL